jgi:hypothetical protein
MLRTLLPRMSIGLSVITAACTVLGPGTPTPTPAPTPTEAAGSEWVKYTNTSICVSANEHLHAHQRTHQKRTNR